MPLSIYIAAPLGVASTANAYAARFTDEGRHVVSEWHYGVEPGQVDPHDEATRREVLIANLAGIQRCDVVFAVTSFGKPRCTLGEIGFALALGKRCLWLQGVNNEGGNIMDAHPLVKVVRSHSEVSGALDGIEALLQRERAA